MEKAKKNWKTNQMKKKQAIIILIIFSSLIFGITPDDTNLFLVEFKGALKNFMRRGDISAKAELSDYGETKHFYALGAIENLKGEIQIFDSKPLITSVIDKKLAFDTTFSKNAALLVYATVDRWNTIFITDTVVTYEQLEKYIEQKAKENQIDTHKPFPFLLEGRVSSFDWHVIDWIEGDKEHSHEKHKTSGLYGTINDREIELLGFYSDSHHAIFTHHTTNMHIHVKTADNRVAGHVDGLTLGKGMLLKLPETE